jgi:hypothetical protein
MRGKAEPGDKTMLDVWEPVVRYMEQAKEQISWQTVKDIAEQSMNRHPGDGGKERAGFLPGGTLVRSLGSGGGVFLLLLSDMGRPTMEGDGQ